jgi:hypothetical protein
VSKSCRSQGFKAILADFGPARLDEGQGLSWLLKNVEMQGSEKIQGAQSCVDKWSGFSLTQQIAVVGAAC